MNENEKVGARIADLRQQRAMRQEDFLELLEADGVSWTRTVLSRVESGTRALKWTEGLVLAKVLGVEPSVLAGDSPVSELDMQIQSMRIKRADALRRQRQASVDLRGICNGLSCMLLLSGIRSTANRVEYVAHGTPGMFVYLLSTWLGSPDDGGWSDKMEAWAITPLGLERAHSELGIEPVSGDEQKMLKELSSEKLDSYYGKALRAKYPQLRFDGSSLLDFRVEGIDVWPDNAG